MTNRAHGQRSHVAEPSKPAPQPTGDDRVRVRAYELYEKRGGNGGDSESDWYQAESELKPEQEPR